MSTARFPVYIPSKSRAETASTPRNLDRMGVPYRLVVEAHQADEYADRYGKDRILVLDPAYQRDYVTCDTEGDELSKGSGPARNFIWDHAQAAGAPWHWVIDDNIMAFHRFHENRCLPLGDGSGFHAMEEFVLRYSNVGMAGPEYKMFVPARQKRPPFILNRKVYSCLLIRTAVPLRWECRYNEDVDLGLRMMKAGWLTVTFIAFLQDKITTQQSVGGNTEAFYASEGTKTKSRMLIRRHPDVAELVFRFHRWHHFVDYRPFAKMRLLPDPDYQPSGVSYQLREIPQGEKLYSHQLRQSRRHRDDMLLGFHPLLARRFGRVEGSRLHPSADPNVKAGNPTGPYRCGSCKFRLQYPNGTHQFLYKCGFGQAEDGSYPRSDQDPVSDLRLWWPACKDYEPGREPLNGFWRERPDVTQR